MRPHSQSRRSLEALPVRTVALVALVWASATSASVAIASESASTTVLYLDRVVPIEQTLADPSDLWVTPTDLTRVNDFVLKPEGACLEELCIPIDQSEGSDIVLNRGDQKWFSLTAFARKLGQEYVADQETRVWSFGTIPVTRSSFLQNAKAPAFTLPNRRGEPVSLADFRGRKVLILSWASW